MLSLEEQIAGKCIHFNGVMKNVCKAGISYADVRVGKPYQFPCLKQGGECKCAEFMTNEQVKEKVAIINNRGDKILGAYASIKDHIKKTKNKAGKIKCQCGGDLHYAVAETNGHIWAKCSSCTIAFSQ